jgi:hypothetical protein
MRHHDHSSGRALIVAVGEARRHLYGGHHDRAEAVLSRHLSTIDPDTAGDDPVLVEAACLYADAVRDQRDLRLRWAAYAFGASRRLYDAYHPRTLSAARILVELAQRLDGSGRQPPPERAYQDRIIQGTLLLRAYLTRLIKCGRTADVHALACIEPKAASR